MVVEKLASQDIYSLYHLHLNEIQGKETTPTLYMYRKKERPYHIDYCFASMSIADQLKTLEIGKHDDWITASDHMPLFIEF